VSVLDYHRAQVFNPLSITSSTPFLWCEVDRGTTFSGDAIAAGTTPPVVTITGVNSPTFPTIKVRIPVGGARGTATYETSFDGVLWSTAAATLASVVVGPFTVNFPVGTYNANNTYDANPQTLADMTAQANHMSAIAATGPLIVPNVLGGRAGFTAGASRYFVRTVLTNSRSITGNMTTIVVGVTNAALANVIVLGGNNGMRDLRTNGSGEWAIVSTVLGAISPVATATANKEFQLSASWDGVNSLGEFRQQGLPTVRGTANPGDPAATPLTAIAFGAHGSGVQPAVGWRLAAIFACDGTLSAAELAYLRDGFAQRYSITT